MSLKEDAKAQAMRFFDQLGDNARRLIGDAVEFRRQNPCFFARYRELMAKYHRERGNRARAKWNEIWAARHRAKCTAMHSLLAAECGFCKEQR